MEEFVPRKGSFLTRIVGARLRGNKIIIAIINVIQKGCGMYNRRQRGEVGRVELVRNDNISCSASSS